MSNTRHAKRPALPSMPVPPPPPPSPDVTAAALADVVRTAVEMALEGTQQRWACAVCIHEHKVAAANAQAAADSDAKLPGIQVALTWTADGPVCYGHVG